jgi:hypothetical protein
MGDESTASIYRNCLLGLVSLLLTVLIAVLSWMFIEIDHNGDMIRDLQQDFEHYTAGGG